MLGMKVLIALIVCGIASTACDSHAPPSAVKRVDPPAPAIVFDTGRGTGQYDQMTYFKYESELALTPQVDVAVRGIRPQMYYCNGTSGFIAIIRDEHYQPLAVEAGLVDGDGQLTPTFSDRHLDPPLTLTAGKTYRIVMEVWTTKSVGIYTTGNRTAGTVAGVGEYVVSYARSDTADHQDRGAIAFELLE